MPSSAASRFEPAGSTATVLHLYHPGERETASVADLVTDELSSRGREVSRWAVPVPDEAPAAWLGEVVDRLRHDVRWSAPPRPSVVHAFGWRAAVSAGLARQLADGGRSPLLVAHLGDGPRACHDDDIEQRRLERLVWAAARAADAVVVDSDWAVERALAAGVPRSRVVRGLPVAAVADPRDGWSPAQQQRPRRLVSVGGVGRSAGTDVLVRAVSRLPDVELVVAAPVGLSREDLHGAQSWLSAEAQRHSADRGRISLSPFSPDLLDDCDAVVDAGTTAGSADGVVTAMAHRRPVLASDLGPRAEAVLPGTTGDLVPPSCDWTVWCDKIARLVRDPFKLEAYGDAGYERSRAGFSPSRRAELIDNLESQLTHGLAHAS